MVKIEPKFMKELHKIREDISKEWKGKTARQIVSSIHEEASKSKYSKKIK